MRMFRKRLILNIFAIMAIMLPNLFSSAQTRLYRWVDENGNTFYSDKVPPEHSKLRRETLSKQAQVVDVTEAAKTKEQWALEKQLEKLKKVQEKLIAKQKSDDKVLLSTFRSEDDLRMTLSGKLKAISAQQKVSQGNLQRLENQLHTQQKKAAGYERDGIGIPDGVRDEIRLTEEQIQRAIIEINKQIEKKREVEEKFQVDIERFVFLSRTKPGLHNSSGKPAGFEIENTALGLYVCEDERQCSSAWESARVFVQIHSTTGIDVDSEKLILSADPKKEDDLSLSVSRIIKENKPTQIFLDIQCKNSAQGEELCASSKVLNLRSAFSLYINSAMAMRKVKSRLK